MKLSILLIVASIFASSTAAQELAGVKLGGGPQVTKCEIGLDDAPSFRGLRLGMTEEAAAAVTGAKFTHGGAAPQGFGSAYVNIPRDSTSNFAGISRLDIQSVDGRITTINILYRPEWRSASDFAEHFIPQIALPRESWVETDGRFVNKCSGFQIQLSLSGRYGELRIDDPDSRTKKFERIEAEKEAQRRALKP